MSRHLNFFARSASTLLRVSGSVTSGPHSHIHNWVRPTLLSFRRRRIAEHEKFPERAKPQRRSSFVEWNNTAELFAFGKRLGEDFDQELLQQALIDASHVHSERKRQEELGIESGTLDLKDNQELAAYGLNILKESLTAFVTQEFPQFPSEGVESVVNRLTSNPVLAEISSLVGTKDLMQSSVYPPTEEAFATSFAAIVGALDKSSGRETVNRFIVDFVASHLCGKDINEFWDIPNPWQMLLGITKPCGTTLEPRLLREAGRNTLLSAYVIGIYDQNKKLLGTGIGESLDIAQEMAARDVLKGLFGTRGPVEPFGFQSANFPMKLIPHVRNH